ncbi:NUDIX hydrolase [Leptospira sp. GIMC2001]|uniref:NUDIX hydrolase n=1 Tax=Leptospira sp. GIMC2001 TaxID=1513297 RepID=UPI00234B8204|nr:NUDIX domain-containing protein [Leptospira sp. GIMC2001]WCL51203.1 NUDIX domain-containing protein [Leptospira sp. GIMC2001]
MLNNINHAVKALIYQDDCKILLQQRDYSPGILFPGYWTFFGGLVEEGESLEKALERELIEELGCLPGKIQKEIFEWVWSGESIIYNHCLPIRCEVDSGLLELNEGLAMKWFYIEELRKELPLVPGILNNLNKVHNFLKLF